MEILNLIPTIYGKLSIFILAFTRISALFTTFVMFRREVMTGRIIIAIASILAIYTVLLNPDTKINLDILSVQMLSQELFEFFIGFLAGLILNIVFEIFVAFGQIVSAQIGISLASLFNPTLGNITTLTQFYYFLTALIFLMLNGHVFIMRMIADSFTAIPVSTSFIPAHIMTNVLQYSSVIFSQSILVALTIIIIILLMNVTLAVITKFSPQINIFSVGINVSLLIGLLCLYITFNMFVETENNVLQHCFDVLWQLFVRLK